MKTTNFLLLLFIMVACGTAPKSVDINSSLTQDVIGFTFENNNDFDYVNATIEINDDYEVENINIPKGEKLSINYGEFTNNDGVRFNINNIKPKNISISFMDKNQIHYFGYFSLN